MMLIISTFSWLLGVTVSAQCSKLLFNSTESGLDPIYPSKGKVLTSIDIIDEMHYEMDITINSFPTADWVQIFHHGGTFEIRQPAIFMHADADNAGSVHQGFSIVYSYTSEWNEHINPGPALIVDHVYHIEVDVTQSSLIMTFDGVVEYENNEYVAHHTYLAQPIYVSDPWHDVADVSISNLFIATPGTCEPTTTTTTPPTKNPTTSVPTTVSPTTDNPTLTPLSSTVSITSTSTATNPTTTNPTSTSSERINPTTTTSSTSSTTTATTDSSLSTISMTTTLLQYPLSTRSTVYVSSTLLDDALSTNDNKVFIGVAIAGSCAFLSCIMLIICILCCKMQLPQQKKGNASISLMKPTETAIATTTTMQPGAAQPVVQYNNNQYNYQQPQQANNNEIVMVQLPDGQMIPAQLMGNSNPITSIPTSQPSQPEVHVAPPNAVNVQSLSNPISSYNVDIQQSGTVQSLSASMPAYAVDIQQNEINIEQDVEGEATNY